MSIHASLNEMWWSNFGKKAVPSASTTKYIDVAIPVKKSPVLNDTVKIASTHISEYLRFGKPYTLPANIISENRNATLVNTTFTGGTAATAAPAPAPEGEDAIVTRMNAPTFDNTVPAEKTPGESYITDPVLIEHVNKAYNDFTKGLVKTSKAPGGRGGGGGHGSKLEFRRGNAYVPISEAVEEDIDTLHEIQGRLTILRQAAEGKVKEKISKDLKKINEKLRKGFAANPMVGGGGT